MEAKVSQNRIRKIETPKQFFDYIVDVDVSVLLAAQTDLRLAYHACVSIWSLRNWVAATHYNQHWSNAGSPKPKFSNDGDLQSELAKIDKRFDVVRDIANASKHMVLNRKPRILQGAQDIRLIETPVLLNTAQFDSQGFNEGQFNQSDDIVTENWLIVETENQDYDVVDCINFTHAVWRGLLDENSW
ncbi:hypothetical protein [Roseiarcus fermentans]|uniref:hypothetical protein n=1 Tax=Roseiarcus fermentans TaxID=1473586 RepID=UPI0011BDBC9F|nr:hypothetical protein [Roseiarcus fermentans]